MKNDFLFPHRYKLIGKIISVPSLIFGAILLASTEILGSDPYEWLGGFFDELVVISITIGLMLAAFSREKIEDEYVSKLRASSLVWAIIVNYIIVIIATVSIYGFEYLNFLMVNLFTVLLLYILKFNFAFRKFKKSCEVVQE